MASPRSVSGRAAASARLKTVFMMTIVFVIAPLVSSACVEVITVTETSWVTAIDTATGILSMSTPLSMMPTATTNLTTTSAVFPISSTLNGTTLPIVSSTSSNTDSFPPATDSGTPVATYNPMPVPAARILSAPNTFNRLTPSPNTGSIRNSCDYDVFVSSVGCSGTASNVKIAAGTTWEEPLRRCDDGGVVYKVSKNGESHPVMQFEAGVWKDRDIVQYDISYLDCMIPNTTDLTACPGWEGGHQVVAGKGCPVFVCKPGEYCDGSSYTVPEFGYQGGGITHPNAGCDSTQGIAFELCACSSRL